MGFITNITRVAPTGGLLSKPGRYEQQAERYDAIVQQSPLPNVVAEIYGQEPVAPSINPFKTDDKYMPNYDPRTNGNLDLFKPVTDLLSDIGNVVKDVFGWIVDFVSSIFDVIKWSFDHFWQIFGVAGLVIVGGVVVIIGGYILFKIL